MKLQKIAGWTCAILLLAVSAKAQTFVPGILKRDVFLGATRAQVEATNPPAITSTTYPSSWNVVDDTQDYTARYSGLISPTVSGLYDFYIAADDDSDLFISNDTNPTNKYLIAQESLWSPALNWITPGGAGALTNQKSSLTFTNGAGATPYSGGFNLTAGTRYYLEAVQHGGGGGNRLAVTMVPHGAGIGDGTDTTLTNTSPDATIGIIIGNFIMQFPTAGNPSSRTNFVGTSATFRAAPSSTSQIPPRFQWQRGTVVGGVTNYVEIPGATNASAGSTSFYTIVASTNDDGARFRCVAYAPGIGTPTITRTSLVATLTVRASGGLSVSNRLKRELFTGLTQPQAGDFLTNVIGKGNVGLPNSVGTFPAFEAPNAGGNYGERLNGFFTPSVSGNYVFFLSSDDESLLFVSTNDQPSGKVLVAQEDGFSTERNWVTAGGNGSIPSQKRSDQWSPDGGFTMPYAAGIPMTAGSRYYIEANHWGGQFNNHLEATFKLTNDLDPLDGDASQFTNGIISYLTSPVTIFQITNQPTDTTKTEGLLYGFQVGVRTDSEVIPAFQWTKNGTPIPGAVAAIYSALALLVDNNAVFACNITIPGVTNVTSSSAVLHVQPGVFAGGLVRREFWTNSSNRGITRPIVGANVSGTFPDADFTLFIRKISFTENRGDNYVQRLSGFFVPPVTTNYVFFLSSDDDSDLYISTDQQPANKYLIAQETSWSNARQWLSANGGGNPVQKRSDQFNGGLFSAGISLVAGTRYYLEIVHREIGGGDVVSATYIFSGESDPVEYSKSRFTPEQLGTLVPPATVSTITGDPTNTTSYAWQPVYFTVTATNDTIAPPTYEWRRNGTNVPDAAESSFGFVASASDNGAQFDCVVSAPGIPSLTKTTTVATLTVLAGGTFVPGLLAEEFWNAGAGLDTIELGGLGAANVNNTTATLDFGARGANYANRVRGFFVPPETTNYVFFTCSDDNSDLFLSTDDQPKNIRLIAQEPRFSGDRNWIAPVPGYGEYKRSDYWSPDGGLTRPYSAGIWMTNGLRYYLEVVHNQFGGGDNFGVLYKMGIDPANDPANADASNLTNGVIGYMVAPAPVIPPILTATQSGSTLTVSWTPPGGTLQSTPTLSPATWMTVGTLNPTNLVIGSSNLFLRVSIP